MSTMMRVQVEVDRRSAIAAGRTVWGWQPVEVDLDVLSAAERAVLADALDVDLRIANVPRCCQYGDSRDILSSLAIDSEPTAEAVYALIRRLAIRVGQAAEQAAREQREADAAREKLVAEFLAQPDPARYVHEDDIRRSAWVDLRLRDCRDPRVAGLQRTARELAQERERLMRQADQERRKKSEAEKERQATERAGQLSDWVATRGSQSQRERLAAGVLPESEIVAAIREEVFAPLSDLPRYDRLTSGDVEHAEDCSCPDIEFEVEDLDELTADQWDERKRIAALMPEGATIQHRIHTGKCLECGETIERRAVLVSRRVGALDLSREYAAA